MLYEFGKHNNATSGINAIDVVIDQCFSKCEQWLPRGARHLPPFINRHYKYITL